MIDFIWRVILAWLTAVSVDTTAAQREAPRASAAVLCARASMLTGAVPGPQPAPVPNPKPECCGECKGTGYITHGDGHKTPCPCPPGCKCKTNSKISQEKCNGVRCDQPTRGAQQ